MNSSSTFLVADRKGNLKGLRVRKDKKTGKTSVLTNLQLSSLPQMMRQRLNQTRSR
jgi:hypothetical protein